MNTVLLKIFNRNGSVQHYYHYLLGFLMPLCINWDRIQRENCNSTIMVRSCALMDKLTREFNFKNFNIVDYDPSFSDIINAQRIGNVDRVIELDGYDFPKYYDIAAFIKFKEFVYKHLEINTSGEYSKVLLIDRLPPDPFYTSNNSEYKVASAGADRRSIPNIPDIKKCTDDILGATYVAALENMTLSSQIQLFSSADVIIAQHGASMANLIWAKPGTHVIEIIPKQMMGHIAIFDYFGELCNCLHLNRTVILQDHYHAAINIDEFSKELNKVALSYFKTMFKNRQNAQATISVMDRI
jgi:hypothetical protein